MSSTVSPTGQNGQPPGGVWSALTQIAIPSFCAAVAIVPTFGGFVEKTNRQQGLKLQRIDLSAGVRNGIKAAPTIGAIIGTQMVAQEKIENALVNRVSHEEKPSSNLLRMFVSCALVGVISAPLLAIFNGQTMGWTPKKSLQELSLKQGGAIVTRETSFILSQRVSESVAATMKEVLGDKPGVDSAAEFVSGGIGSIVGHPADTALTRLQKKLPPARSFERMNGGLIKAATVGAFTVLYNRAKEFFQGTKK